MNPKTKDIEKIQRIKCETEGYPNKADVIFKTKYFCQKCSSRENPKKSDLKLFNMRNTSMLFRKWNIKG